MIKCLVIDQGSNTQSLGQSDPHQVIFVAFVMLGHEPGPNPPMKKIDKNSLYIPQFQINDASWSENSVKDHPNPEYDAPKG